LILEMPIRNPIPRCVKLAQVEHGIRLVPCFRPVRWSEAPVSTVWIPSIGWTHGTQVQQKASERLQALEHPAIDVLARFLTAPELATMFSTMLHPSTVLNAAKIVLDRTGHKPTDKLEIQTQ
jgi:hypothetical protein